MFAQKLSKWHLLSSWLIIFTIVVLFGSQLVLTQFQNLEDEIEQFKTQELDSRVLLNKSAISQAITYIDHERNQVQTSLRKQLKSQTLAFIEMLKEAHAHAPLSEKSAKGLAQVFSSSHDIQLRFHRTQLDHDLEGYHVDEAQNRVGFIHYFAPLDTYVLGYQNLVAFEQAVKEDILNTLRYIRFGKENSGYIFILEVNDLDGGKGFAREILLPIDPAKEGMLIDSDVADEFGNRYREDYLRQIKEKGFAITRYVYPIDESEIQPREKISYLEYYEPWGWIIGTGVYFEHLAANIDAYKARSLERLKINLYFLALFLVIFSGIAYAISRYFNRRLMQEVTTYEMAIKTHQSALNQYKHAVVASTIYSKTDPEGKITDVNEEFCRISGYSVDELLGNTHSLIRHPDESDSTFQVLWETIQAKRIFKGVLKNRSKSGVPFYASTTIVPILNPGGEIQEYIALRIDITEQMEQERRIQRQITDRLTGLSNIERLREDMRTLVGDKLALVKIIGLKDVSSFYGQEMAEALVKLCAKELQLFLQHEPVMLYRFAFDTFALLGNTHGKKEDFLQTVQQCIHHLRNGSKTIDHIMIDIGAHAGVAFGKEHVFEEAEAALDQARSDRQEVVVFNKNLAILSVYQHNIEWTRIIKSAIEDDRILAYGQAIVDAKTQQPCSYEVLMRLQKEDGTVVPPMTFLHVAKYSNLYSELTRHIVRHAFAHFSQHPFPFSINLSAEDIYNNDVMDFLEEQIIAYEVGTMLTLEIVETESVDSFERVARLIGRMKRLGVKIAIDDFGTGYSNFEYLLKIEADYIKIDGSLIRDIDHDPDCQKVVAMIVEFAKNASMQVVAEFVHSEAVLGEVKKLGITKCQGYYFHIPCALDDIKL